MVINLYQNQVDKRKLNKPLNLLTSVDCDLLNPCTLLNPEVVLEIPDNIVKSVNYVYIPDFNRYYFIKSDGINILPGGLVQLSLEVDPLMSWRSYINSLRAYILRNEFEYSKWMNDDMLPTRVNRIKDSQVIGSLPTDQSGRCVVLTVSSGGGSNV